MKRFLSILLIIAFIFNICGYFALFSIQKEFVRREIKKEIRKGFKDEELTLISDVNESEMKWTEKEKEFRYKGEMYDIVKTKIQNGKKLYYCINDKKEKQLIEQFIKNEDLKKKTEKKLKNIFSYQYFPQTITVIKNYVSTEATFAPYIFLYDLIFVDIHFPPPKTT